MTTADGPSDEFWITMLRGFLRANHVSGLPIPHGHRKRYADVVRYLEKRQIRALDRSN